MHYCSQPFCALVQVLTCRDPDLCACMCSEVVAVDGCSWSGCVETVILVSRRKYFLVVPANEI